MMNDLWYWMKQELLIIIDCSLLMFGVVWIGVVLGLLWIEVVYKAKKILYHKIKDF